MNDSDLQLVTVVVTAVAFDFTNGFHDGMPCQRQPFTSSSASSRCS